MAANAGTTESGSATAAMPENMIATAIKPGSSTVAKLTPAMGCVGFMAGPPVMCGITYVNTKRNSSGFMHTRTTNGNTSRRST